MSLMFVKFLAEGFAFAPALISLTMAAPAAAPSHFQKLNTICSIVGREKQSSVYLR